MRKDLGLGGALNKQTSVVDKIIGNKFGTTPPYPEQEQDENEQSDDISSNISDHISNKQYYNTPSQEYSNKDTNTDSNLDALVTRNTSRNTHSHTPRNTANKQSKQKANHTTGLSYGSAPNQSVADRIRENLGLVEKKPIYVTVTHKLEDGLATKLDTHCRTRRLLKQDVYANALELYFELIGE